MSPSKVVCNWNFSIDTPPTASLTSVNLKTSLTCNCPFGNKIVKVVLDAVVKGLSGKKSCVPNSVLAGLALCKACGSALVGFGSSYGDLGSYSDLWTHAPVHSLTISLYGNAMPDLSEIAKANLPCEKVVIN